MFYISARNVTLVGLQTGTFCGAPERETNPGSSGMAKASRKKPNHKAADLWEKAFPESFLILKST